MSFAISLEHLGDHNRLCHETLHLSEAHLNMLYGIMGQSVDTLEQLPVSALVWPSVKDADARRITLQSLLCLLQTVPDNQQDKATRLIFLTYHHLMVDLLVFVSHSAITPDNFRALSRAAYALRDIPDADAAHQTYALKVIYSGRDLLIGAQFRRELRDLTNSVIRSFEMMANALTYPQRAAALAHLFGLVAVVEVFRLYFFAGAQLKLRADQTLTVEEIVNRADDFGLPRAARFFDFALADMAAEVAS